MFKKSLFLFFLTILFLSFTQAASESHLFRVEKIYQSEGRLTIDIVEAFGEENDGWEWRKICESVGKGDLCNVGRAQIKIEEISTDRIVTMSAANEGTFFDTVYERDTGNYFTVKAEEDLPLEKVSFVVRKPNGSPIEKFTYGWNEEGNMVLVENERYRPDKHNFVFSTRTDGQTYSSVMIQEASLENFKIGAPGYPPIYALVMGVPKSNIITAVGLREDEEYFATSHDNFLKYKVERIHKNLKKDHYYAIVSWKGPTDQHTACVNKQCVIVEGVGENECRIDRDCKLSKGNTPGTPGIMFSPPAEGAECNWFQKIFFKSKCN